MSKKKSIPNVIIPEKVISNQIFILRGKKVMFDRDLAELYGVPTKRLNEQVRRNSSRFPEDFMFQLDEEEYENLRSQFATSSSRGGLRYSPYVFTEQGISMLSSVLNSERAIQVNIAIMRTFTKLRELMLTHKDLAVKIEKMERKFKEHDQNFEVVFKAIQQLLMQPNKGKDKIGFHVDLDKS
ncbi:MAG: hypothetical protein ACI9F2_000436 [Lysobacterales bacterium]|jgi:hypothetical protein